MRFIFQKFIFQLCIIKRKIIFKIISSIRETFTYYFSFSQLYLIVNKTWENFSTLEKRKGIFCCSMEKFSLLLDSRNLNFNWVGISISKIFPLLPPLLLLATISDYTRGGGGGGNVMSVRKSICSVGGHYSSYSDWWKVTSFGIVDGEKAASVVKTNVEIHFVTTLVVIRTQPGRLFFHVPLFSTST